MFLSQEQIVEVTGKERPSAQARWFIARGWRFERRGDGKLVVHELEAQKHLCGTAPKKRRTEPDLEPVRG